MGLSNKGVYASVRRNAESAPSYFGYNRETGLFGKPGNHIGIRVIETDDPVAYATELFDIMRAGGEEYYTDDSNIQIYLLPDQTYITLRLETSSDSPAVEINVQNNPSATKVQYQKIHFIKKEN